MATEKQFAANRANAKKSHGPTSDEGILASSFNLDNFRHGLAVKDHMNFGFLHDENPEKFKELLNALCREHNPTSETESILVRHMAESEWLRARALRFQAESMDYGVKSVESNKFAVFIRYQNTHERAFYKALIELQNLRKQKQNAEIGIESHKLKQAAEIRATEVVNLKKEEFLLKKEVVQMKKEAQVRRNPPSPAPAVADVGLQMAA